jgi:hypothetical protein
MATKTATKPRTVKAPSAPRSSRPTRSAASKAATPVKRWKSRAVLRNVEAGSSVNCVLCDERVKFQAKVRHQQVICNVYLKGVWDRVEHFHSECYTTAGAPYGEPEA